MKVTPEMLLFLAGKMGLDARIDNGRVIFDEKWQSMRGMEVGSSPFEPPEDFLQFGRLVVWAPKNGYALSFSDDCVVVFADGRGLITVDHNNTESGIMEATVVAVCRALGWEDV